MPEPGPVVTAGSGGHALGPGVPRNRLAAEASPYLLQHAGDPVDWHPWGPDALARAAALDRPIFLSVGYAACHWCHVMHRESFADAVTAQELNDGFVSIKVDREERPDVDALYMEAVQALTGSGGWPMSVFLTPEGRPFYAGTYFPAQPRHGLPGFRQVLAAIREAWLGRRLEVDASAGRIAEAIADGQRAPALTEPFDASTAALTTSLETAIGQLLTSFDARTGGWGGSPKFPLPVVIELLLREHLRSGASGPLDAAIRSLDAMADGGIHDQLGGGFARYATDSVWLVPHFEQMLYDNAQLAACYLHAWRVTGAERHAEVARGILRAMERELLVRDGDGVVGFGASLDADTDGHEGATYVWSLRQVEDALGPETPLFAAAYGVTAEGNWEGRTILSRVRDDATLAAQWTMTREDVQTHLAGARERLLTVRARRPQPPRDDKVLGAWNGLALVALAEAGRWLPDGAHWTDLATGIASSLHARLRTPDGRLRRSWKDGRPGPTAALEDHTHLAAGLLALYQTTFEERWYAWATELMEQVERHFADPAGGAHDTPDDASDLFARPRSLTDQPAPSGNAMAVSVRIQLAALTGQMDDVDGATLAIMPVLPAAQRQPTAFAHWLIAAGMLSVPLDEVAIVGDRTASGTQQMVQVVREGYRPWQVVALANDRSDVPLLRDRPQVHGLPTAYVCHGGTCRLPVTDPAALRVQLRPAIGRLDR